MESRPRILAVVGPTASGKSALAVKLAQLCGGEIVSCDSIQIYRGMDIGSAKPTAEEMEGVPHHMLSVCDPGVRFSCMDYAAMAVPIVEDILARGRQPILCGGTGLYLDALLYGDGFSDAPSDMKLREELEKQDSHALHDRLRAVDPETAEAVHPNNRRRVIRALEVYLLTGESKTAWDARSRTGGARYDSMLFALCFRDRAALYDRINRRVDAMLAAGLAEEAAAMRALGPTAAQAIGYKELWDYLDGREPLNEAAERVKQATRNYAKRQMTWFRRYPDRIEVEMDGGRSAEELAEYLADMAFPSRTASGNA